MGEGKRLLEELALYEDQCNYLAENAEELLSRIKNVEFLDENVARSFAEKLSELIEQQIRCKEQFYREISGEWPGSLAQARERLNGALRMKMVQRVKRFHTLCGDESIDGKLKVEQEKLRGLISSNRPTEELENALEPYIQYVRTFDIINRRAEGSTRIGFLLRFFDEELVDALAEHRIQEQEDVIVKPQTEEMAETANRAKMEGSAVIQTAVTDVDTGDLEAVDEMEMDALAWAETLELPERETLELPDEELLERELPDEELLELDEELLELGAPDEELLELEELEEETLEQTAPDPEPEESAQPAGTAETVDLVPLPEDLIQKMKEAGVCFVSDSQPSSWKYEEPKNRKTPRQKLILEKMLRLVKVLRDYGYLDQELIGMIASDIPKSELKYAIVETLNRGWMAKCVHEGFPVIYLESSLAPRRALEMQSGNLPVKVEKYGEVAKDECSAWNHYLYMTLLKYFMKMSGIQSIRVLFGPHYTVMQGENDGKTIVAEIASFPESVK